VFILLAREFFIQQAEDMLYSFGKTVFFLVERENLSRGFLDKDKI